MFYNYLLIDFSNTVVNIYINHTIDSRAGQKRGLAGVVDFDWKSAIRF